MRPYRDIIIGAIVTGTLAVAILMWTPHRDVQSIRLERIIDPLPHEELYDPHGTWYPPYLEDDSSKRITLIWIC